MCEPKCTIKSKGRTLSEEEAQAEKRNDAFLDLIEKNDVVGVAKALSEGQDPNVANESGESAVHLAMRCPTTDILKALIVKGAYLEFEDTYSKRPIEVGIENGADKIEHVRLLLGHQVVRDKLTRKNAKSGTTLLHTAAWVGNTEATRELLGGKYFEGLLEGWSMRIRTQLPSSNAACRACSL